MTCHIPFINRGKLWKTKKNKLRLLERRKKRDLEFTITRLISDESEAISQYTDAINYIDNEDIKKKLIEIREDEQDHLKKLNDILFKI